MVVVPPATAQVPTGAALSGVPRWAHIAAHIVPLCTLPSGIWRLAVAIASMWREVLGVRATLANEEWQSFLHNRQAQRLQVYRSGWVGDYNDANTFAEAMIHGHGLNDMGWHDPEYERLVREAGRTADAGARRELLERAERLMLADYPMIPIYYYVSKSLVRPEVGGYRPNIMNVHPTRHLYLKE
jgi:oligopeptide transport system substrate-binding protein